MIVVGSHGRGPTRNALLGSVTRQLLTRAQSPTVLIGVGSLRPSDESRSAAAQSFV